MEKRLIVIFVICMFVWRIFAGGASAAVDHGKTNTRSPRDASEAPPSETMRAPSVPVYPLRGVNNNLTCADILPQAGTKLEHAQLGDTWYDFQKNGSMGRMISVTSSGYRHFSWMYTNGVYPGTPSYVYANCEHPIYGFVGAMPADGGATNAGYTNQTHLHTGESVIIYHRTAGSPIWYSSLTIEDENCNNCFTRKWDIPDYISDSPSGQPGMWPKADVLYDAVYNRDYIHVVMTEGNTAGGVPVMVAYERNYIKDGPGSADTLISQCFEGGSTKIYKVLAGVNGPGAFAPISHFDFSCSITPVVTVSPVSRRVAIAYLKPADPAGTCNYLSDVCYIESINNGDDWIAGIWPPPEYNITHFGQTGNERAVNDLNACYDFNDSLHIVYVTAGFDPANPGSYDPHVARLYHWSKKSGISMLANAIWEGTDPGQKNLNIAKMSISAPNPIYHPGDDSVYLYTIWTQFDTADNSAAGYTNGEIYGSGSYDGGNTWGGVYNLTNTKTPNCAPGTCVSEHWSSLAQNMYNGDLHIQYICDLDAGGSVMGEGQWMDVPVMYLHLSEWPLSAVPRGTYRIESPSRWYGPPLKVTPNGSRILIFKVFNIGNANLIYSVTSDDPCIQCNVSPNSLAPKDSATVTANVIGTGACNNSFIDGNVILTTNEGGGKTDYLPVQAVVANDYYECPIDPETYDTLENGVLRLYANASGQMRIYDIGTRPDTTFEIFYNGGTIVATTRGGDTLVGRYMGQNDQHTGARDRLHLAEYSDYWTLSTGNVFIHDLNPPMNPKWWWWEMSTRIVFFKPNAADDLKHGVIEYVTVERHDPPAWWPDQTAFSGYEDTYIGVAYDIDCPSDTMGTEKGRNLAGYDEVNNIAWQRGWDYTGAHPEYNNYYAGIALVNGGQLGDSTTPYGTYNVKNNHYLYPQGGWGWMDGELYRLAKDPLPADIEDPDSVLDRTQVLTARKICAGANPNARASFTVVVAEADDGVDRLEGYVDGYRTIAVDTFPSPTEVYAFNHAPDGKGNANGFDNGAEAYIWQKMGLLDNKGKPGKIEGDNIVDGNGNLLGEVIRHPFDPSKIMGYRSKRDENGNYKEAYDLNSGFRIFAVYCWPSVAKDGTIHIVKHGLSGGGGIALDYGWFFAGFGTTGTNVPNLDPYTFDGRPGDHIKIILDGCWTTLDPDGGRSVAQSIKDIPGIDTNSVQGQKGAVTPYMHIPPVGEGRLSEEGWDKLIAAAAACQGAEAAGYKVKRKPGETDSLYRERQKEAAMQYIGDLPFSEQYERIENVTGETPKLSYGLEPEPKGDSSYVVYHHCPIFFTPEFDCTTEYFPDWSSTFLARLVVPAGALSARSIFHMRQLAELPEPVPSGLWLASGAFDFRYQENEPELLNPALITLAYFGIKDSIEMFRFDDSLGNWVLAGGTPVLDTVNQTLTVETWTIGIFAVFGRYIRGDATGDGVIDVGDVVFLINYLFKSGIPPFPLDAGDANCDGVVDIGDVVYLINYLFKNGPPPGS